MIQIRHYGVTQLYSQLYVLILEQTHAFVDETVKAGKLKNVRKSALIQYFTNLVWVHTNLDKNRTDPD